MKFESELPSTMIPYNVKSINMELFAMPQLKKLSKASALDSMLPIIDALEDVLDIDPNTLTDGDYYYLMCYQRIVGYSDSALLATWKCENMLLREQGGLNRLFVPYQITDLIESYEAADEKAKAEMQDPRGLMVMSEQCNAHNVHPVTMDDIECIYLTDAPLDPRLDYPRLSTLSDALLMYKDPERRNLVDAARWVRDGDSLADKFQILEQQSSMDLFQAALKANITHKHGVNRYVAKNCVQCAAKEDSLFEVTASLFFQV